MELRTLRYFLTAASEGNLTRAAKILHVTQPTLSRQLMDLEEELGTVLVIRNKRGLILTEDGMLFKQQAAQIIEMADRTEQLFVGKSSTISGVVSIGATEAIGSRLLAKIIKQFSEKYPLIRFQLYNETADDVSERIDSGLIDVGLLLEPVNIEKYNFIRFPQKETWGVLMRQDHPLAEKEYICPKDIVHYPLILPMRAGVREEIIHWIGCEEKDLKNPLSYTLLSNAVLLVENGLGCAFCLDGALAVRSSPNLCFVPIFPERSTRSVLVWKKNYMYPSATSLFIQELNSLRVVME